jgi:hypothetical protein
MNRLVNPLKFLATLALVVFALGCATQQKEKLLTQAGFRTSGVSTPEGQQHLKTLTPGKITPVKRGAKTYYIFPDPAHNRVYVGDQAQYQKYRQLRSEQKLTEEQIAAQVNTEEDKMLHQMLAGWD